MTVDPLLKRARRTPGVASRKLRLCAALATGLVMFAGAARAQSPGDGGGGDGGGSRGGKNGVFVPIAIAIPLIALGAVLITRAMADSPKSDGGQEPKPRRPAEPGVKVVPGAAPIAPGGGGGAGGGQSASPRPPVASRPSAPVYAADNPALIVPAEVLLVVKAGVTEAGVAELARRYRLEQISVDAFTLTGTTIYRFRILGKRPVAQLLAALRGDARIASAQPNHVYNLAQDAASSLAATQYAVGKMRLSEAHASATGADVAVAVIDSGVDVTHPSLKDAVADTFDAVGEPFEAHPHGTAVAGLVAARGDLASPAPAARVLSIRAFGAPGPKKAGAEGTTMHILRGIDWAAQRGARVVNMSFAGPRDDQIQQFIAAGVKRGVIYVAAAGNAGPASPPLYPAADPNVIAVTATDADDKVLKAANRGKYLGVSAPGVDVVVAAPGGGYSYMSGTSMASAEVAGVVALMVQAKPDLTPAQARAALASSAVDLGKPGPDPEFGAGATDAKGAVDAVSAPPSATAAPPSR